MKRTLGFFLALIMLLSAVPAFAVDNSIFSELDGYVIHADDMTGEVTVSPTDERLLIDNENGGISFSYTQGKQLMMSLIHNDLKGFAGHWQVRTDYCLYDVTFNTAAMSGMGMNLNINGAMMFVNADCADMLSDIANSENAKIRLRNTNVSGEYADFLISQKVKSEIAVFMQAFDQDLRAKFESADPTMMLISGMMSPSVSSKEMDLFVPEITDDTTQQPEAAEYTPEVDFYQIQMLDVYGTTGLYIDIENIGAQAIDAVNMYVTVYDAYGKELTYMGNSRVANDMAGIVLAPDEYSSVEEGINIGFMGEVQSVKVVIYKYHKTNGETVIVPSENWNWVTVKKDYSDTETVKQIQQALNDLGYQCGMPDGQAGTKTKQAITQYQKAQGRKATGKISWQLVYDLGLAN